MQGYVKFTLFVKTRSEACIRRRSLNNIPPILVNKSYARSSTTELPTISQQAHSFGRDNDVAVDERDVHTTNHYHQEFEHIHLILDSNVHCTPAQFEQEWKLFLASDQKCFKIEKVPTIEKCYSHFSSRRIYSVACGGNDESIYRIYFISRAHVVKFLGELKVDVRMKRVSLKIKSNDLSLVSSFFECLQLEILLGHVYLEL
jgi:hypothetical protein